MLLALRRNQGLTAEALLCALPSLKLPHPEIAKRRFVLEPLAEIAPELRHPFAEQNNKRIAAKRFQNEPECEEVKRLAR